MLSQHRFDDAEKLLGQAMAAMPESAEAKLLLAIVVMQDRDRLVEATDLVQQSIVDQPDIAWGYQVLSRVLRLQNKDKEALAAALQAVEVDPHDEDSFSVLAETYGKMERWKEALEAAENGLRIDPEDESCSSMRLLSLERLGRVSDALAEGQRMVERSPDSADAHEAKGWAELNQRNYRAAQVSFREALRLDPSSDFARHGMAEAIKQTNFLYRWLTMFNQWLSRFSGKGQIIIVVVIWLAMTRLPKLILQFKPEWAGIISPIRSGLFLLVMMTWILPLLANTVLRFHSFGRYLLTKRERAMSTWMGINLLVGCLWIPWMFYWLGGWQGAFLALCFTLFMAVPIKIAGDAVPGLATILCMGIAAGFNLYYFSLIGFSLMGELGGTLMAETLLGYVLSIFIYSIAGQFLAHWHFQFSSR